MLDFLIDNIFVLFGGRVFQQTIGIPMCTRRFVSTCLWGRLPSRASQELNHSRFGDYLHRIHAKELEVKDTTNTLMSAFYFDLHLEIDNGGRW